jgi:UDP-glucose 4-epimerase
MQTLILGGNGFIGSHLVDKLLTEGHKVRVFDRYDELYRRPLSGVDYVHADFGNRGSLSEALKGVDWVFHLISTTLPKTSNDDPIFDVQSNLVETLSLLEQCVVHKVKKIVYVSSGGTVYGIQPELPVNEDCPTRPECSYGIVKLAIENYLALFNRLYDLDYTVLRPSNPFGPRQNPVSIQGVIAVFLGKVAREESLEIWGDGEIIRDYVFVDDVVSGIYKAASSISVSRTFNLGSGVGFSLNEIVDCIRNVTGRTVTVNYQVKRCFDVPAVYLDIDRACRELNWQPETSLENGIRRTWSFISSISS